jgi:hypothetical protein
MSGIPEFNFPAFFKVQARLEIQGWRVFNPANKEQENGVEDDPSYVNGDATALIASGWSFKKAYKWDTARVIDADAIYMLKGWEKSPGARGEHAVAMVMQTKYPDYEIIYEQ